MKNRISFDLIGRIKGSVKNWLLPHPFKIVGQVLLLIVLVALVTSTFFTQNSLATGDVTIDMTRSSVTIRAISIALYLAVFLITCSREKEEDEMTAALRGETLKEIGYLAMAVWLVVRVAMTFAPNYVPSITHDDSTLAPFIIWALYYGRFERKMKALRQQSREFKL